MSLLFQLCWKSGRFLYSSDFLNLIKVKTASKVEVSVEVSSLFTRSHMLGSYMAILKCFLTEACNLRTHR